MAIADPTPRIYNTPSGKHDNGDYGMLRKNGTNIAVFALPNPKIRKCHIGEAPQ